MGKVTLDNFSRVKAFWPLYLLECCTKKRKKKYETITKTSNNLLKPLQNYINLPTGEFLASVFTTNCLRCITNEAMLCSCFYATLVFR